MLCYSLEYNKKREKEFTSDIGTTDKVRINIPKYFRYDMEYDRKMEKDEFETRYAERSGVTIEWLHDHNQYAVSCDCGEDGCPGWQMVNKKITDYRPQFIRGGNNMENGGQNSISPDFICGDNFYIGSFCVIEEDVVVGDNVTVGNLVVIKKGQRVPDGATILDHVVWC